MRDSRINVRVPEELKRRLDHAIVDRDTNITAAVIEAMKAWLAKDSVQETEHGNAKNGPSENPSGVVTSDIPEASTLIPPEFAPWVARLLYVLRHNFPKAVTAIKTNLVAFEALTEMGVDNAPPPTDEDPLRSAQASLDNAQSVLAAAKEFVADHERVRRPGRKIA